MSTVALQVAILIPDGRMPVRATNGAAGYDLFAAERTVIPATTTHGRQVEIGHALVRTGIALAIPIGCVGRLGSRSGLSVHHNLEVGAGWIDSDYRGEILVEVKNLGRSDYVVEAGARIAQLIVLRLADITLELVQALPETSRGGAGMGSTGV